MWWSDTSAGAKGRCLNVARSGESQSPGLIDIETCSNRWSTTVNNLTKAQWLWTHYIGKLRAARRGRGRSISCYIVKAGSKTYEHIGATWLRLTQCGTRKSHHKGQPQQHLNPSGCHWMMIMMMMMGIVKWWMGLFWILWGEKVGREWVIVRKRRS